MNSYNEKLMPFPLTEINKGIKSINKTEISALPKKIKKTRIIKKFDPEIKSITTENNSRNGHETFGNDDEKGKNQNKLAFQPNFYCPHKKQKSSKSRTTNKFNEKLLPKNSITLNILNDVSKYKEYFTDSNKNDSISTKNSFKYNNKYIIIHNLKQEKMPLKKKNIVREKSDLRKISLTNSLNNSFIYGLNDYEKAPLKIETNQQLVNDKLTTLKLKVLEMKNKELNEEINKLKKELEDKDKIIKMHELKIKEYENTIKETKINKNKEIEKLLDEIKKIKSTIPFDILPGEKIMSIIFKSDDENILYSILCKNSDKFIGLKNIIYDKYPQYKEYENSFLFNKRKINENETLEENKIKDGSIITIYNNYN